MYEDSEDFNYRTCPYYFGKLHYNIPVSEFENALKWSSETRERNINALIENKLLMKKGDYYQPTLGIFDLDRGNLLEEKARKVANEIADSICVFGNKRMKSNVGWDNYKDKNIHVFDENDTQLINHKMPEAFFPCLLDILKRNKPDFEVIYRELNFDKEVSFEEFFIFWYHWIYTETADILIAKDIIHEPQNEMFYYQVAVNY